MADLNNALATAVKTGKVLFGAETTLKIAMSGKVSLIVIAANCPKETRESLEYYCKLSEIPMIVYPGTSLELGRICNRPFFVSVMAIRDPGSSEILKMAAEKNV